MDQSTTIPSSPTETPLASILLPTLAGLSIVLCLPPLVTHVKSRNVTAGVIVFWITLINLFNFINPLIWPSDDLETRWDGAGLCDIEVKLNLASSAAIPGALICVFRQLSIILDTEQTTLAPSRGQRRRRLIFEVFFCILCPLYMIVAHLIVQPYRYYIFAISGCVASFDNSWPGIILIFIPPLVLSVVAAGYCVLVVVRLLRYRRQFSNILASSQSRLNKSRFLRLFVLSTTLIVILLPVAVYVFTRNLGYPRHPFSWSAVHGPEWSTLVVRIPTQGVVNFDRWLSVGIGYAVFLLFGFGKDTTMMYRSWLLSLGLGTCFPKLNHPHLNPSHRAGSTAKTANATKVGSMSSRAKLIFHRKQSAKTISTIQTRTDSTVTSVAHPSPTNHLQPETSIPNKQLKLSYLWSKKDVGDTDGNHHDPPTWDQDALDRDRPHSRAWSTNSPVSHIEDQASIKVTKDVVQSRTA